MRSRVLVRRREWWGSTPKYWPKRVNNLAQSRVLKNWSSFFQELWLAEQNWKEKTALTKMVHYFKKFNRRSNNHGASWWFQGSEELKGLVPIVQLNYRACHFSGSGSCVVNHVEPQTIYAKRGFLDCFNLYTTLIFPYLFPEHVVLNISPKHGEITRLGHRSRRPRPSWAGPNNPNAHPGVQNHVKWHGCKVTVAVYKYIYIYTVYVTWSVCGISLYTVHTYITNIIIYDIYVTSSSIQNGGVSS